MTEWQVVGVISALAVLFSGIAAPIIKLNGNIVRMTEAMEDIEKSLLRLEDVDNKLRADNRQSHKEFYDRLDRAEKILGMYDLRIVHVESKVGSSLINSS